MQPIEFIVPYPPTANNLYVVSKRAKWSKKKNKWYYPRFLAPKARSYKKYVSELIAYTFPKVKYGTHPIGVYITVSPPNDNRIRDIHNGEKILFDAIQESGIIDNDHQILDRSSKIGEKVKDGQWKINIKPLSPKEIKEIELLFEE
jgi:Holliday junction resolvase RusA-like endonuclease